MRLKLIIISILALESYYPDARMKEDRENPLKSVINTNLL